MSSNTLQPSQVTLGFTVGPDSGLFSDMLDPLLNKIFGLIPQSVKKIALYEQESETTSVHLKA